MSIPIPFQRIKKRLIKNYYNNSCAFDNPIYSLYSIEDIKNYHNLCLYIKEHFHSLCRDKILDVETIDLASREFNKHEIYHNKSINKGHVLISGKELNDPELAIEINGEAIAFIQGDAHATLSDRAIASAFDNSNVRIYGNATLYAYGNASVFAFGETHVCAYDNSFVRADSYSSVVSHDSSSVRAMSEAHVRAKGNSQIVLMGLATAIIYDNNVTVEAKGASYISSYGKINCKLKEEAIYHDRNSNTIYYSKENMKFKYTKKIEL